VQRRWEEAIADFNKAMSLTRNLPKPMAYGVVYTEQGRLEEAIADFTRAIELDPKLAPAYVNRGVAYAAQDKVNEAIADYDKAVEIDPRNAATYHNRGLAHAFRRSWTRPSSISPERLVSIRNSLMLTSTGGYLRQTDRLDAAIADCSSAIELDPQDAAAYNNGRMPAPSRANWRKPSLITPERLDSIRHSPMLTLTGDLPTSDRKLDAAIADLIKAGRLISSRGITRKHCWISEGQ